MKTSCLLLTAVLLAGAIGYSESALKVITGFNRQKRQDDDSDSQEGEDSKKGAAAVVPGNKTVAIAEKLDPVTIGSFRGFVHAVDSGDVIVLDEKTLEVPDFSYDGEGPASYFVVGSEGEYTREMVDLPDFTVIPDENESCTGLRRYNSQTIKLTLPGKLKVSDISYLSLYCLRFNHNFGYVTIPDDIKIPKAGKDISKLDECEIVESGEGDGSGSSSGGNSRPRPRPRPPAQGPPAEEEPKRPGLLGGLLNILG